LTTRPKSLPRTTITSRNQPKSNHSIYDYMRLVVVYDWIWEYLQLQDQISTILIIFTTMMQLLEISSYWLVCLISHNNHQISCILKVFYNDIGVYFNVCTKIIYIICILMHIVHIMNLKINIRTLNFLFKSEILYFNSENCYFNCSRRN